MINYSLQWVVGMVTLGFGETHPIATISTPSGFDLLSVLHHHRSNRLPPPLFLLLIFLQPDEVLRYRSGFVHRQLL